MNTKISKIEKIIQECTETQLKEFAAYITANYQIDDDILKEFLESKNKKSKKSSKSIESDEESEDEAPKKKVKSKKESSPKSTKPSKKEKRIGVDDEESDDEKEKKAPAKKSSPKKSLKERISAAKKSDKYYNASTGRQCGKTEQQIKKGLLVFYDDLHVCGKKGCDKLKAVLKELGHNLKDSSLKKEDSSSKKDSSKRESKVEKKKKVESSDTEEDESSPKKEKVVAKKEKKVEKKKIETSDTEEEEVVEKKDKVVVKDMEFEKNDDDNFEHKGTGFVIDPKTEKVFGKQNEDGDVLELTTEDIDLCLSKEIAHSKVPQKTIDEKIVELSSKKDDSFDFDLSDTEL